MDKQTLGIKVLTVAIIFAAIMLYSKQRPFPSPQEHPVATSTCIPAIGR
jgi:hypothetical protein